MDIVELFDRFNFDDYGVIDYQIRVIKTNFFFTIDNAVLFLINNLSFPKLKFPRQSIPVNLF